MTIAAILQSRNGEVISVDPDMPVSAVVKLLAERRIGAVPVIQGGRVLGIFSERDVIYRLGAEGPATLDRKVGEVMTAPALTVDLCAFPDIAVTPDGNVYITAAWVRRI